MMRTRIVTILALLVAALTVPTTCAAKTPSRPFRIVAPAPGSVINNGTIVSVQLPQGVPRRAVRGVDFAYARAGAPYAPIDGQVPELIGRPSILWNTESLKDGLYTVRARLRVKRGFGLTRVATVRVRVNEQPYAVATARITGFGSVHMEFSALESTDRGGGRLLGYRWNFGDGGTAEGTVVNHVFTALGDYGLSLTVTDDRGGLNTAHYVLQLYRDPMIGTTFTLLRKEECGCSSMRIKWQGAVEGPAALTFTPYFPKAQARTVGPFNDGAAGKQLNMKRAQFAVQCRFEVIANLADLSLPELCAEGQRVQRSMHLAGVSENKQGDWSSDPRYDAAQGADDPYDGGDGAARTESGSCGYGTQRWCDDDYHGGGAADGTGIAGNQPPSPYKRHEGQERILWLDAPGFTALPRADLAPDGAWYKAKFTATVSGTKGTCTCTWEVLIEVDASGKVISNKVHKISCTSS